ncbi:podocalyxin [Sigmodon hispidus]
MTNEEDSHRVKYYTAGPQGKEEAWPIAEMTGKGGSTENSLGTRRAVSSLEWLRGSCQYLLQPEQLSKHQSVSPFGEQGIWMLGGGGKHEGWRLWYADGGTAETSNPTTSKPTTVSIVPSSPAPTTTVSTTTAGNLVTTASVSPAQSTTAASPKVEAAPTQSPASTITTSPPGSSGGIRTTVSSGSQSAKTDSVTPSSSNGPTRSDTPSVSSGGKSNVTIASSVTHGTDQLTTEASSQPPLTTSKLPPASTTGSTATPGQLIATPPQITDSHSTSVSSLTPSPDVVSVSPRKPTTHTPLGTSEETPLITSQTPGISTEPLSTPPQPTGSPVGTSILPTTEELTQSSSNLTPTAPQGPSTPSSIWTFRNYKLKCDSAIMSAEELLTLNFTGASLCVCCRPRTAYKVCEGSPPDEKLLELLCRSVKASFKPAQDQCTLQVAPIVDNQAVAVKTVLIETKLSPRDVYELLKDKWDDLREAGVNHMALGREGPPEVNEDRFSLPLIITIVCMASFLLLIAALYGCCHQRVSQRKDQQRLTEELQTVENGYHDNPTLEVMETPSEMQEKKVVNLNGELGDSWIVPLENLTKDDLDEEEDTHL